MRDTTLNPFNITKAVDFSDQEINDYWVDMPAGATFTQMAKPTSPMPMLILGGKGSGKTHLMRYFSYSLQSIRHGKDVLGGIQADKYLGIYLRCGGLNSARFRDKGQTDDVWADVFAYYMELWLSQLVLNTVLDAVRGTAELEDREPDVVNELGKMIRLERPAHINSLTELRSLLHDLQQELDSAVNNSALTRTLPVKIAITRGDLVFGIPRILAGNLPSLRDCLFLYLIDEFENLSEIQQKYLNTLLRERQSPCSFKIGARNYGVRTYSTFSADEDNKEGSEFEILRLDAILRENEHYGQFARQLIAKRLTESDRIPSTNSTLGGISESLDHCFEELNKSRFSAAETQYVIDKYRGRDRPYFKKLRDHLESAIPKNAAPGLTRTDIDSVVRALAYSDFPLLEKMNLFLFYKEWSSKRNLLEASTAIAEECRVHVSEAANGSRYDRTLDHFKYDLLAQLYRETDQKQRYVGLETFIDISAGVPRNLLILLKHIFAWATFNGEHPFRDKPISIRSQQAGVSEASEWFYRDARMIGRDGQFVMDSINRLGTLFRGIRFSEKPSECSCSTFSGDLSRSSESARRILDVAEKWSLLVNVGGQRDRNTERIDAKYQMNRMLAPRWDLSVYRRGVLAISPDEITAIFDPERANEFDRYQEARIARMTAPFFGRPKMSSNSAEGESPGPLFENGAND